jgi:plastocyanin domain-containing protein
LSGFIAWFFWFAPKGQTRASTTGAGGAQEVAVTVKGGYTPDVIVVQAGQPVRLRFTRQESASCSEMVLFPDFSRSARLPEGEEVAVEFTPDKAGEYGFQCQMGMLRGKLIVES